VKRDLSLRFTLHVSRFTFDVKKPPDRLMVRELHRDSARLPGAYNRYAAYDLEPPWPSAVRRRVRRRSRWRLLN